MENVKVFVSNNDISKAFLVILKKRLPAIKHKYRFSITKISDNKKIAELKSKGVILPVIKVGGRTISGFDNCSKFINGQVNSKPAIPQNNDDINDYIRSELWKNKDEQEDVIGDVMDENAVKQKMRDRMNNTANDTRRRGDRDNKEQGDAFDTAMANTKFDNVDTEKGMSSSLRDEMSGVEMDDANMDMMSYLMNNVSAGNHGDF